MNEDVQDQLFFVNQKLSFEFLQILLAILLLNYNFSLVASFYFILLYSLDILDSKVDVFSEHFFWTYLIASVNPVSVLLSDELDLLFLSKSLLLEGWAKGSSSSRIDSRVKLSWVEEMSLSEKLSVIFSKNLVVLCIS